MSEIITATVASDDVIVNVNETLLYKGDKGDKGDTGATGPQGYSIVANVIRTNLWEDSWEEYGTTGHEENWIDTENIRNGCRIGDIFTVTGNAPDTGNGHTLFYRSTTASGTLYGTCIGHVISKKGDKGDQGPRGEKGDAGSVENLKIGGVNLLNESSLIKAPSNNSNFFIGQQNNATFNFTSEGLTVITNTSGNYNNGAYLNVNNANSIIKPGEKVTFSIDLKGENIYFNFSYMFQGDQGAIYGNIINSDVIIDKDKIDDFTRYSFSFTMPYVGTKNTSLGILLRQGDKKDNCKIIYRNAKLERGETPTDWTPSLKDYERNTLSYANMENITASHVYSVGDFLEVNGSLKKVTSAIADGQEINASNTVDTTITDELKAIYKLITK